MPINYTTLHQPIKLKMATYAGLLRTNFQNLIVNK